MRGRCFIIRWADDFIIGCEMESDAKRLMEVLPKRFNRYGLSLHSEKTRLIVFRKPSASMKSSTFDFLGFTFYWAKSLRGYWIIKKKTVMKRQRRFMKGIWRWCSENRHEPIGQQHEDLCAKLRGYYQYFGVRGNYKSLEVVYEHAAKAWRYWLSRRSRKGKISWKKFEKLLGKNPLPKPRIAHAI